MYIIRLRISNTFLPMPSSLQLLLVISIGVLFVIQWVLAYLRVRNHPGPCTLLAPGGKAAFFLPAIPGVSPGHTYHFTQKHDGDSNSQGSLVPDRSKVF